MSSSTLSSSLLFTLSLIILISHVPLSASGAELYETVCNEAEEDKDRCLQVCRSDPRISSAKNYAELSKYILEMAVKKGTEAQNSLKELMKTQNAPAIKECATVDYDGVVGSFKSALGELDEDPQTASYDDKVAGDGPQTCEKALAAGNIKNPSITTFNNEISLLSKISFLATNKIPE